VHGQLRIITRERIANVREDHTPPTRNGIAVFSHQYTERAISCARVRSIRVTIAIRSGKTIRWQSRLEAANRNARPVRDRAFQCVR
jgi:hypothetical protein